MSLSLLLYFLVSSSFVLASYDVDLGRKGNLYALKQYKSYLKKTNHCELGQSKNPRVIISGFGSWKKNEINLSSAMLDEISHRYIDLTEDSFFGEAVVETVLIEGQKLDICFLKLAVAWDISSAILIHEVERFKPTFVLMLGDGVKGRLIVETKARNSSSMGVGYDYRGNSLGKLNKPRGFGFITGRTRAPKYINMNWMYDKMESELTPLLSKLKVPYRLEVSREHRKGNIFICNAISYGLLRAVNNHELHLFRNKLKIKPDFRYKISAGFLHLPSIKTKSRSTVILKDLNTIIEKVIQLNI